MSKLTRDAAVRRAFIADCGERFGPEFSHCEATVHGTAQKPLRGLNRRLRPKRPEYRETKSAMLVRLLTRELQRGHFDAANFPRAAALLQGQMTRSGMRVLGPVGDGVLDAQWQTARASADGTTLAGRVLVFDSAAPAGVRLSEAGYRYPDSGQGRLLEGVNSAALSPAQKKTSPSSDVSGACDPREGSE